MRFKTVSGTVLYATLFFIPPMIMLACLGYAIYFLKFAKHKPSAARKTWLIVSSMISLALLTAYSVLLWPLRYGEGQWRMIVVMSAVVWASILFVELMVALAKTAPSPRRKSSR